jgi:NAD(P)-dependent dehydrogenase (short-subunit alcohol dehydrogenase family)
VRAEGFVTDVTDRPALVSAFDAVKARFGDVDVLEYFPAPSDPTAIEAVCAVDLTVEALRPQLDLYLFGGLTAVQQVVPGMIARGSGTILVSTGASSGPVIHPPFASIAAASGELRNWVLNLHAELKPRGVYAAHVAIATWIGREGPASQPEAIAETYWELHRRRHHAERLYTAGERVVTGRLADKVALVSGAARGIGADIARLFAAQGAAVMLTDICDDEGRAVAAAITNDGGSVAYRHLDVRSRAEWDSARSPHWMALDIEAVEQASVGATGMTPILAGRHWLVVVGSVWPFRGSPVMACPWPGWPGRRW